MDNYHGKERHFIAFLIPVLRIVVTSVSDAAMIMVLEPVYAQGWFDYSRQVCGINMRNATHEHAVTVLRQCGDNLSMKVQYNPESEFLTASMLSSCVTLLNLNNPYVHD